MKTPKAKAKEMYQSIKVCFSYDEHNRARTYCINVCNEILSYEGRRESFYEYYREVKKECLKMKIK